MGVAQLASALLAETRARRAATEQLQRSSAAGQASVHPPGELIGEWEYSSGSSSSGPQGSASGREVLLARRPRRQQGASSHHPPQPPEGQGGAPSSWRVVLDARRLREAVEEAQHTQRLSLGERRMV